MAYKNRFVQGMLRLNLSLVEQVLLGSLVLLLTIGIFESLYGTEVGDPGKIRLVKLQAQQELMAQRIVKK